MVLTTPQGSFEVLLSELGLCTITRDEAFYFLNKNGIIHRVILTHIDDFNVVGTPDFIKKVIDHVAHELTVPKIEEDTFRFTGLDIKVVDNGIKVSIEHYTNSLQDINKIRKVEICLLTKYKHSKTILRNIYGITFFT